MWVYSSVLVFAFNYFRHVSTYVITERRTVFLKLTFGKSVLSRNLKCDMNKINQEMSCYIVFTFGGQKMILYFRGNIYCFSP